MLSGTPAPATSLFVHPGHNQILIPGSSDSGPGNLKISPPARQKVEYPTPVPAENTLHCVSWAMDCRSYSLSC